MTTLRVSGKFSSALKVIFQLSPAIIFGEPGRLTASPSSTPTVGLLSLYATVRPKLPDISDAFITVILDAQRPQRKTSFFETVQRGPCSFKDEQFSKSERN